MTENELSEVKQYLMKDKNFLDFIKITLTEVFTTMATISISVDTDRRHCPKCGAVMNLRVAKDGRIFYGCTRYPSCKGILNATEEDLVSFAKINPTAAARIKRMSEANKAGNKQEINVMKDVEVTEEEIKNLSFEGMDEYNAEKNKERKVGRPKGRRNAVRQAEIEKYQKKE